MSQVQSGQSSLASVRSAYHNLYYLIQFERSFPTAHDPWKANRVMQIAIITQSALFILAHRERDFSAFKY